MMSRTLLLIASSATLLLSGCGSSAPSLPTLTTGSIFGSSPPAKAEPAPITAVDRGIHLGAVTARAAKCGYNFDPGKLRQDYLAYEASSGGAPDALAKATDAFDRTNLLVAKSIAKDDNYCSTSQTKQIKADLTKAMAGDFSPPIQKRKESVSWLESGAEDREVANWEAVFDPHSTQSKTKRVTDDDLQ